MEFAGADLPPVLFVVLDSVRRDRLSLYGHGRETTPALQSFAERATVYENAVVPAAWTLPSHTSMFTGLFPSEHGVTNGFLDATGSLGTDVTPLPERLRSEGYRTAGFSNNPWVGSLSGLDEGFEEFVEWNLEIGADGGGGIHSRRDRLYSRVHSLLGHAARQPVFALKRRFFTGNLVERAARWLEPGLAARNDAGTGAHSEGGRSADGPQFTFLNLMEAHSPYFPPGNSFRELDLPAPGVLEPRLLNTKLLAYVMGRAELPARRRQRVLEYYDASLRYQDREFGTLLDAVPDETLEEALVVVCADHGKTLGEYDRDRTPPHYVCDINTTVPLVVKYPGQREGRRVREVVELARLADLVRDGGRRPLESYTPRSGDGCRYGLVEEFVPHTGRERGEVSRWRALVGADHKLVRGEDGSEFLYERTPPGEREREVTKADVADCMAAALDERVDALAAGPSSEHRGARDDTEPDGADLDSDVEAQLGDLGYL